MFPQIIVIIIIVVQLFNNVMHFIVYGINIQYNRIVSNHLSIPDNLGNVVKIDMSFFIVTVTFMIAQMITPE